MKELKNPFFISCGHFQCFICIYNSIESNDKPKCATCECDLLKQTYYAVDTLHELYDTRINYERCINILNKLIISKLNSDSDVFDVEKIKDMRFSDGKPEFLVKWLDYNDSESSWLTIENLNCNEKVIEFLKKCKLSGRVKNMNFKFDKI